MKKTLTLILGLCLVLVAGMAWAFPNDTGSCSGCHPQDSSVVVTFYPYGGCCGGRMTGGVDVQASPARYRYGWATFDGATKVQSGYGSFATNISLPSPGSYTIYGVAGWGTAGGGSQSTANWITVDNNCRPLGNTIVVTKAIYTKSKKTLTVEATSQDNDLAHLSMTFNSISYPMTWDATRLTWTQTVVTSKSPGTVTVSGCEGSVTAQVRVVK